MQIHTSCTFERTTRMILLEHKVNRNFSNTFELFYLLRHTPRQDAGGLLIVEHLVAVNTELLYMRRNLVGVKKVAGFPF